MSPHAATAGCTDAASTPTPRAAAVVTAADPAAVQPDGKGCGSGGDPTALNSLASSAPRAAVRFASAMVTHCAHSAALPVPSLPASVAPPSSGGLGRPCASRHRW